MSGERTIKVTDNSGSTQEFELPERAFVATREDGGIEVRATYEEGAVAYFKDVSSFYVTGEVTPK